MRRRRKTNAPANSQIKLPPKAPATEPPLLPLELEELDEELDELLDELEEELEDELDEEELLLDEDELLDELELLFCSAAVNLYQFKLKRPLARKYTSCTPVKPLTLAFWVAQFCKPPVALTGTVAMAVLAELSRAISKLVLAVAATRNSILLAPAPKSTLAILTQPLALNITFNVPSLQFSTSMPDSFAMVSACTVV